MGDLSQRVRLIHELRERVGTEEGVDHRGDGLRIDQVDRGEDLIVTYVHSFTNDTCHTVQSHAELGV